RQPDRTGRPARRRQRHRPVRRGALPVHEGHPRRQEEAGRGVGARRPRARPGRDRCRPRCGPHHGHRDRAPPTAAGRHPGHRRGRVRRRSRRRVPHRRQVPLSIRPRTQELKNMSNVLVVVDHVDGAVTKPSTEVLTIARQFGEPVAVAFGPGAEGAAPTAGEYGATALLAVTDPAVSEALVAPRAEVLDQLVRETGAPLVLLPSGIDNTETAGRLAVRTGAGLITDAVA